MLGVLEVQSGGCGGVASALFSLCRFAARQFCRLWAIGRDFRDGCSRRFESLIRGGGDCASLAPKKSSSTDPLFHNPPIAAAPAGAVQLRIAYWIGEGTCLPLSHPAIALLRPPLESLDYVRRRSRRSEERKLIAAQAHQPVVYHDISVGHLYYTPSHIAGLADPA